jgi:hypothetical protein
MQFRKSNLTTVGKLLPLDRKPQSITKNFLTLWKYADQGIAAMENVRERLLEVQNSIKRKRFWCPNSVHKRSI